MTHCEHSWMVVRYTRTGGTIEVCRRCRDIRLDIPKEIGAGASVDECESWQSRENGEPII